MLPLETHKSCFLFFATSWSQFFFSRTDFIENRLVAEFMILMADQKMLLMRSQECDMWLKYCRHGRERLKLFIHLILTFSNNSLFRL